MFFKGKPFKDENMISEFSKNYNLKRIEQRWRDTLHDSGNPEKWR